MRICFVADLHANLSYAKQLLVLLEQERPDVLLLGGDTAPTRLQSDAVEYQRRWMYNQFTSFLAAIPSSVRVFWASGNHDLAGAMSAIDHLEQQNLLVCCDGRWVPLDDKWQVMSFPFGPLNSGWKFLDWERRDSGQPFPRTSITIGVRILLRLWELRMLRKKPRGYITTHGHVEECNTHDWVSRHAVLETLFADIPVSSNAQYSIMICHYPPFGTRLDQSAFHSSLGSRALHKHLRHSGYALAAHGHVHESPYLSGYWMQEIGTTPCVNPGQWGKQLHAVLFDTIDILGTLRHTLFGTVAHQPVPLLDARHMRQELQRLWKSMPK
jgi:Icc-related predicted phosphoesterase